MFENRYIITKDLMKLWAKEPVNRRIKLFKLFWLIMFLFFAALTVAMFVVLDPSDVYLIIMCGIFTLFCAYRRWVLPKIRFRNQFKILSEQHGSEEWERIISISDKVAVSDGTTASEFEWTYFSKVNVYCDKVILISKNNLFGIRVYADSFTLGNLTDFLQFLKTDHLEIQICDLQSSISGTCGLA
jgi:hypothetical protein